MHNTLLYIWISLASRNCHSTIEPYILRSIPSHPRSKKFSIIESNVTISSIDTRSLFDFPGTVFNLTIERIATESKIVQWETKSETFSRSSVYVSVFVNSGTTMTKESKLSTRVENRQRVRSRGRETRWSWYVELPLLLDWICYIGYYREKLIGFVRVFVPLSKICWTSELSALYFGLEHFSFRCIWRWLKDNADKGWNGFGY